MSQQHAFAPAGLFPTAVLAFSASSLPFDDASDASSPCFCGFFLCFTSVGILVSREDVEPWKLYNKKFSLTIRRITNLHRHCLLNKLSSFGWMKCDKKFFRAAESWAKRASLRFFRLRQTNVAFMVRSKNETHFDGRRRSISLHIYVQNKICIYIFKEKTHSILRN